MAALVKLGAGVFHHVGLRGVATADLGFVEELLAHRGEGERIDVELRDLGAQHGVERALAAGHSPQRAGPVHAAGCGNHLAFVAEEIFRHVPAAVDLADIARDVLAIALGHLHIVEEGFAERAVAADKLDRLGGYPGVRHVEQHEGDALILVRLVRADEAEDPVGLVGIAGPDFLAVDDPVVAPVLAEGLHRDEVRARARLRIALAPADFAARDLIEEALLLPLGAKMQQRWPEHPDAEARERRAGADPRHLLAQDLGLGRRESRAAVFLGPGGDGVALVAAGLEPLALRVALEDGVAPAPVNVFLVAHRLAHFGRAIRFQPGARVGAELVKFGHRHDSSQPVALRLR